MRCYPGTREVAGGEAWHRQCPRARWWGQAGPRSSSVGFATKHRTLFFPERGMGARLGTQVLRRWEQLVKGHLA